MKHEIKVTLGDDYTLETFHDNHPELPNEFTVSWDEPEVHVCKNPPKYPGEIKFLHMGVEFDDDAGEWRAKEYFNEYHSIVVKYCPICGELLLHK